MEFCQSCSEETKYRCLLCQKPACNSATNCSIGASEESPGLKTGVTVGICIPCSKESKGAVGSKRKENIGVDLQRNTTVKQKSQASKRQHRRSASVPSTKNGSGSLFKGQSGQWNQKDSRAF